MAGLLVCVHWYSLAANTADLPKLSGTTGQTTGSRGLLQYGGTVYIQLIAIGDNL